MTEETDIAYVGPPEYYEQPGGIVFKTEVPTDEIPPGEPPPTDVVSDVIPSGEPPPIGPGSDDIEGAPILYTAMQTTATQDSSTEPSAPNGLGLLVMGALGIWIAAKVFGKGK